MRKLTRLAAVLAIASLMIAAMPATAGADPAKGFPVTVHCPEPIGSFDIVEGPGEGAWVPGHVVTDNGVFIPTAFDFTVNIWIDPPDADPFIADTVEELLVKAGHPRSLVTCDIEFDTGSFPVDDAGTEMRIEGSGTVTGFLTPAAN